jgi:predicted Zn-dependent peptidase
MRIRRISSACVCWWKPVPSWKRMHELGIAHFLEHMAFNGTQHFPAEGQAIETFQRHGLAFGQHVNARTGFLTTVYHLELPHLEAPD